MKNLVLSISLLLASVATFGQSKINFVAEQHEFGEINEGRMASHEFEFVNTGDQPLIISNVQASCGCTTPFWTKEPILPGQKGSVKATYNTNGRPGSFNKSITVTSNAVEPTKALVIKGNVIGKDKAPAVTEDQKANSAKIVFEKQEIRLGKLEVGQAVTAKFKVKNTGKTPLEIYDVQSGTYSTTWRLNKGSIKPNEDGLLEVTYTPRAAGEINETITVTSTDYNNYFTKVALKATVVPSTAKGVLKDGGTSPFK